MQTLDSFQKLEVQISEVSDEIMALLDYRELPFPTACNTLAHTVAKLMRKEKINLTPVALQEFMSVFTNAVNTGWYANTGSKTIRVTVERECLICKKAHTVDIPVNKYTKFIDGLELWKNGMVVQEALPFLNNNELELIISGLCDKAFDEINGDCEE